MAGAPDRPLPSNPRLHIIDKIFSNNTRGRYPNNSTALRHAAAWGKYKRVIEEEEAGGGNRAQSPQQRNECHVAHCRVSRRHCAHGIFYYHHDTVNSCRICTDCAPDSCVAKN